MTERQNIEWKRSWQDEYLKWICGFANAQGGSIFPRKAGYIDSWGRGIEKITNACTEYGCPVPIFEATPTGVQVTLLPNFKMTPFSSRR
jgi:predicted HTH transcriptional regulator